VCRARTDCSYVDANRDNANGGWSVLDCKDYRGQYTTGMVCGGQAATPTIVPQGASVLPCNPSDVRCEYPRSVNISMFASVPAGKVARIFYTFETGSPVTPSTGSAPSTVAAMGEEYTGTFSIDVQIEGCNIGTQIKTIRAVSVVEGLANSEQRESPQFIITTANGLMPADFRQCRIDNPTPLEWCEGPDPKPPTQAACVGRTWGYVPPRSAFGGCMAYRFWMFMPTALSSTTVDTLSIADIFFFFRDIPVEGAFPYSFGVHPGGESPHSLTDGDPLSKFTGLDSCPIIFDFGRPVAIDSYYIATSDDCNSRDPVRWTAPCLPR